jgi:predicted site-specific integrase-resolvase
MEIKPFYTKNETLAILLIGHSTLERWTRLGEIKSYKTLGGLRMYPIGELKKLLGKRIWEQEIVDTPEVERKVKGRRSRRGKI